MHGLCDAEHGSYLCVFGLCDAEHGSVYVCMGGVMLNMAHIWLHMGC